VSCTFGEVQAVSGKRLKTIAAKDFKELLLIAELFDFFQFLKVGFRK